MISHITAVGNAAGVVQHLAALHLEVSQRITKTTRSTSRLFNKCVGVSSVHLRMLICLKYIVRCIEEHLNIYQHKLRTPVIVNVSYFNQINQLSVMFLRSSMSATQECGSTEMMNPIVYLFVCLYCDINIH